MKNQSGTIILLVLILTTLVGFCIHRLHQHSSLFRDLTKLVIHSERAHTRVLNESIDGLSNLSQVGLRCKTFLASSGSNTLSRILCGSYWPFSSQMNQAAQVQEQIPGINFELLFKNTNPCSNLAPYFPPSAFEIGFGSVRAARTCRNANLGSAAVFSTPENFSLSEQSLHLVNAKISALGYFEILSQIEVQGSAIFLSGGDMYLHTLRCLPGAKVTIVSATGKVRLDSFEGSACLRMFSKQRSQIPHEALLPHDLLPALRESEIIGVYPPWHFQTG